METQRQSAGLGEKARRKFSRMGGRAPGYRLSPGWLWLSTKNALYYCARSANSISWVFFREFVHDGCRLDHSLSVSCTKEMHTKTKSKDWRFSSNLCSMAVLSGAISSRFRCPRPPFLLCAPNQNRHVTQATFPKIQAWAHNRNSRSQPRKVNSHFLSLSWLLQLAYFVKCKRTLPELNFYQPYPNW